HMRRAPLRLSIRAKILLLALGLALPSMLAVGWLGLTNLDRARDTAVAEGTAALRMQAEETLLKRAADKAHAYETALIAIQQQTENVGACAGYSLRVNAQRPAVGRVWVSPNGPSPASLSQYSDAVARAQRIIPLLTSAVEHNPLINIGYIG